MSLPAAPLATPRAAALATLLAAGLAFACATPERPVDTRPLVLVTVPPQAFIVERIAGELVRVESLLSGASDPHHHEPSFEELRNLSEAEVWVKVGHPDFSFEVASLDALLLESPGLVVVNGAEGARLLPGDPHLWLAPRNAALLAGRLTDALVLLLPEEAGTLRANRDAFFAEVSALELELAATLAPVRGRWFLAVHPAWGYLAEAYGLEQVSLEHDGREPDPKTLAGLIARGREARLPVVFVEPQFSQLAARTVAGEIGARVETLDPLARDWADNLRRVAAALAEGCAP